MEQPNLLVNAGIHTFLNSNYHHQIVRSKFITTLFNLHHTNTLDCITEKQMYLACKSC